MTRVKTWSYSAYSDYEKCPALYKFARIDKIKVPEPAAFAKGNRYHKLAEDYLRGVLRTLPDELSKFAESFEQLRGLDPFVEQEWGFTASWRQTGWMAQDVWFRAKCDAAVVYPDGEADIVDHKTGKQYDTNEDQIELFSLAAMSRFPEVRKVTARLWYLESGKEVVREFDASQKQALRAKWEEKIQPMFADTRFSPRPNDKCRWCAYSGRHASGPCAVG